MNEVRILVVDDEPVTRMITESVLAAQGFIVEAAETAEVALEMLADGFVPEGSGIVVRLLIMIPILLVGHGINLFMSTISSFVHPMRLTFVEFYKNAGFEMSMRSFDPLRKIENSENK